MRLRDRILRDKESKYEYRDVLFANYGVIENPFPAAGQPIGHPHLEIDIDDAIIGNIQNFEDNQKSQIIVIEGTQGVGKTNLLNYYQDELEDLYYDDMAYYIIRYYPDPEPSFDVIIRKIIQEFGYEHLEKVGRKLSKLSEKKQSSVIETARNHDVRTVSFSLLNAAIEGNEKLKTVAANVMEWLLGLRVLKRHKENLGINFRLDTIESKTQAFRDIIYISVELGILKGIFLLLDELEKHDHSHSKTQILRYLYAIRALIDALPTHLFLMMAITVEAKRRYFKLLPALAGRLQNNYSLKALSDREEAHELYNFYLEQGRRKAKIQMKKKLPNVDTIFQDRELFRIFDRLLSKSADRGIEGVTHRDFLHSLNKRTQNKFDLLRFT